MAAEEVEPLTASGTLRAREVRVATARGGRIASVPVGAGQAVGEGEVLVELDAQPLLLQLGPAEAAVEVKRADLAVVRAGPRAEELRAAESALALAEAEREGARLAWEHALERVASPQEVNTELVQARSRVALAEQGVELADSELRMTQYRFDRQRATQWELAEAEAELAAARAELDGAQVLVARLEAIRARPLGLIAEAHLAEGEYRVAEEEVAVARARLADLRAGPTSAEIAVAEAEVAAAEAEAKILRVQVEQSSLRSPIDGVVVESFLRAGELAAPGATILTVARLDVLMVEVYVPVHRLGEVFPGQVAEIHPAGSSGASFAGEVVRIGDQPEFTPRNVSTPEERANTFYAVTVRLNNPEGRLRIGLPVEVVFLPPRAPTP